MFLPLFLIIFLWGEHIVGYLYGTDYLTSRILDIHLPGMQGSALVHNLGKGSNRIALADRLDMSTAHVDAHGNLSRTERQGTNTRHILGKSQRSTSTQETERLAITLIYLHRCLKRIRLRGRNEMHSERLG